jgi:hypothetical protein
VAEPGVSRRPAYSIQTEAIFPLCVRSIRASMARDMAGHDTSVIDRLRRVLEIV